MPKYECRVNDIEQLRLPQLYRVKTSCGDVEIVFEMHEKIMMINKGEELSIVITSSKEECMKNDFCGKGHVVSITKLEDVYRVVISIAGILVVLFFKQKPKQPYSVMNEVYVGISKK